MKQSPQAARALMNAACKGADVTLFDQVEGDAVEDALSYCDRCPAVPECEDYVQPRRSYFDGVCAGKVWRNGHIHVPGLFEGEQI